MQTPHSCTRLLLHTCTIPMHQALLHTYLLVEDIAGVAVRGLAGRTYVDKVDGGALKTLQAQDLGVITR